MWEQLAMYHEIWQVVPKQVFASCDLVLILFRFVVL